MAGKNKKEGALQDSQERDELERNIRNQVKEILKGDRGEKSIDEDGVTTVILNAETNPNGGQTQLRIEDYPKDPGNFIFVSKLLGENNEPDGYIIINKQTGRISGKEKNIGIDTLREFFNLLPASNNHPAPQRF